MCAVRFAVSACKGKTQFTGKYGKDGQLKFTPTRPEIGLPSNSPGPEYQTLKMTNLGLDTTTADGEHDRLNSRCVPCPGAIACVRDHRIARTRQPTTTMNA